MQAVLEWVLLILSGALYLAQLVSSIDFPLAQRLGIQESAESSDPLLQRSERYVAYWDLLTLLWMPVAAVMMIAEYTWWPIFALIAGAIYFDTAGREAVKNLSFRHHGLEVGTPLQQRLFWASYVVMAFIGVIVTIYAVISLSYMLAP